MKELDIVSGLINDFPSFQKWVMHNFIRRTDSKSSSRGAQDKNLNVTLNSLGYLSDTLWNPSRGQVKMSVSSGDTLTIASGYEYLVAGLFTVSGTVIVTGNLVVL